MNAVATPARTEPKWERLSAPIDPLETVLIARAQSILTGPELGVCPPLSVAQAKDVIAWHRPQH